MLRIGLMLLAYSSAFGAGYCDLIGTEIYAQDKDLTFLGVVTDNPYNAESITNKYGNYGSKYSSTSILNEYGTFGSKYSAYSPYNAYTTTPPVLLEYDPLTKDYSVVAYLTKNKYIGGTIADPDVLFSTLLSGTCGGVYVPPTTSKPDLIIDSLTVYFTAKKDSINVFFIVANIGGGVAPAFAVGTVTEAGADTSYYQPLSPNKYFSGSAKFKILSDTTLVVAVADIFKNASEENEDNNLGSGEYLTPLPKPTAVIRQRPFSLPSLTGREFDLRGRELLKARPRVFFRR